MGAPLAGRCVSVRSLVEGERRQMFTLFARYYHETSWDQFHRDLCEKDEVIILRDGAQQIRGFSTLRRLRIEIEGELHYGIFSGDTVVDEPFWGTKLLGRLFLWALFRERLRRPRSPLWWFLISKGYKTYLLMANNFPEHWPRYERVTPAGRRALIDGFATALFPERYRRERGIVEALPKGGRLRAGVATITEELFQSAPRVQFFAEQNPDWAQGDELACVARMSWSMPLRYVLKALLGGRASTALGERG